ncbi:MAG TPA: protein-methionine-sulfoxide reductase heme-binding subunit MsrQ [Acidobacteriaceae bacterium]|jgi:sulfoxide reductase heme-binding subunit YedZ|nr:protein-methionine-sulfoxide reductase heme-binding subunit MsrQ [Acidobacteriaceae bacterium]
MPNRFVVALKFVVFPLCLVPLGILLYQGFTNTLGPDPVATITHQTGFWTLYLLLGSLAITPVRHLSRHLSWLVRFRRMLGLFAFFYATLHLTTYVWLFSNFDVSAMAHDVVKRPFITVGFAAWLILLALAATSTKWSIRKLGGKRWQWLHRAVYLAATFGVIHYWWIVKTGVRTPWKVTVVLLILLLARVGWSMMESARKKRIAVPA